jgi:hypothetical protein
MRCSNPGCNAQLYPSDLFCGKCGRPVSTCPPVGTSENASDLFPLYGVTLGETTVDQLTRLGTRSGVISKEAGKPYDYIVISGTNFWYHGGSVAESIYIARGIHQIPERWKALGFDWNISYNQWVSLLQRLGYSVRIEEPPQVVRDGDHDSLRAGVSAVKRERAPIEIQLNFNYSRGTTTDSQGTLYSIFVKALNTPERSKG